MRSTSSRNKTPAPADEKQRAKKKTGPPTGLFRTPTPNPKHPASDLEERTNVTKQTLPKNTKPKPPASGLKGGTDVTEWMTSFFASQKKTSERSEIRSDVARKEGFEPSPGFRPATPLAGEPLRPLGYFRLSSLYMIAQSRALVKLDIDKRVKMRYARAYEVRHCYFRPRRHPARHA